MIRTPGADIDRVQTPRVRDEDDNEQRLRPRRLDEFIGQRAMKAQLEISIRAAQAREEALDHVLFAGPPGLGKTSLARIVAEELGVGFVQTAGPVLQEKRDIASFLTSLEPRSVLFVDEIHRLPPAVEETFYPAMEDGQLPITFGTGPGARMITLPIPAFTLIGATTRAGLLSTPLRDRFGIQHRLDHYDPEELAAIVARSAKVFNVAVIRTARPRSPSAPAAPRAWPTGCSSASATMRRSTGTGASTPPPPTQRSTCSRSTMRAWTAS